MSAADSGRPDLRADDEDLGILDGDDQQRRAALITAKLEEWRAIAGS